MFCVVPARRANRELNQLNDINLFGGDFDKIVNRMFGGLPTVSVGAHAGWGFDLQEKEDGVVIRAEAPGFETEDFELNLTGDQLTIQAARKTEADKENGTESQIEFLRSVTLPNDVDPAKAEAQYRNGVLTVTLPKSEKAKGTRIAVAG